MRTPRATARRTTRRRPSAPWLPLEPVAWHAYSTRRWPFEPSRGRTRSAPDAAAMEPVRRDGYDARNETRERAHTTGDPFAKVAKRAPLVGPPPTETVILFAHGCAYTALSWATTVEHLAPQLDARVLLAAFDARHHGESVGAERWKRSPESADARSDVDVSAERLAATRRASRSPWFGAFVRQRRAERAERANETLRSVTGEARARRSQHGRRGGHEGGGDGRRMPARTRRYRSARRRVGGRLRNGGASDALRATETFLAKRPKGFATKQTRGGFVRAA